MAALGPFKDAGRRSTTSSWEVRAIMPLMPWLAAAILSLEVLLAAMIGVVVLGKSKKRGEDA